MFGFFKRRQQRRAEYQRMRSMIRHYRCKAYNLGEGVSRLRKDNEFLQRKVEELSSLALTDQCKLYVEQGGTYQVFRIVDGRPSYEGRVDNLPIGVQAHVQPQA